MWASYFASWSNSLVLSFDSRASCLTMVPLQPVTSFLLQFLSMELWLSGAIPWLIIGFLRSGGIAVEKPFWFEIAVARAMGMRQSPLFWRYCIAVVTLVSISFTTSCSKAKLSSDSDISEPPCPADDDRSKLPETCRNEQWMKIMHKHLQFLELCWKHVELRE